MVIIKKYSNRRLYHTGTSSYVNLDQVTALIRTGEQIQVVDAKSGQDLTREILLQIMMEVLQSGDLFPTSMLHRVIRATGDDPWSRMTRQQMATGLQLLSAQMDQLEAMVPKPARPSPVPAAEPDVQPVADEEPAPAPEPTPPPRRPEAARELDALREQLAALEARLKR
jgi:polyhydroxyalkanoate synthesis repressor PhaR